LRARSWSARSPYCKVMTFVLRKYSAGFSHSFCCRGYQVMAPDGKHVNLIELLHELLCIAAFRCVSVKLKLKTSWTHLTTPSRYFVKVRWRSLFRSTYLGKRCISYNAPPTFRKLAAHRWSLRNLNRSSLFMIGKAHKSHGARSGLYGGCCNGVPPIHFFQAEHWIQFRSRPMLFLGFSNHEKGAPKQEISKW
jgi:hypothetical protein